MNRLAANQSQRCIPIRIVKQLRYDEGKTLRLRYIKLHTCFLLVIDSNSKESTPLQLFKLNIIQLSVSISESDVIIIFAPCSEQDLDIVRYFLRLPH